MKLPFSLTLVCAIAAAVATGRPKDHGLTTRDTKHVIHETRAFVSRRWEKQNTLQLHELLPMRIGLLQQSLEDAEDALISISDTTSPNYGKHWNQEEVVAAFQPHRDTVEAVIQWLVVSGIQEERITHSDNKGWLAFDATVEEANSLLSAKYELYEDTITKEKIHSAERYYVPAYIQEHIDYIMPGVKMVAPLPKARKDNAVSRGLSTIKDRVLRPSVIKPLPSWFKPNKSDLATCNSVVTPDCIAAAYSIPPGTVHAVGNNMAILQFGDSYSAEDLDLFFSKYVPRIPNGTYPILKSIAGGTAPASLGNANGEADMDFEVAIPIIYPQQAETIQVGGDGSFNTLLDAIDGSYCTYAAYEETGDNDTYDGVFPNDYWPHKLQCGIYKFPNVLSISYGNQESDFPAFYQRRMCNEFLKLGLQGVTVVVASGDTGTGGYWINQTDQGCLGRNDRIFSPTFPNTCPWITNVGATKIPTNGSVFDPQEAYYDNYQNTIDPSFQISSSGGGFSNVYPIPKYQAKAVAKYFYEHDPGYPYYSAFFYNKLRTNTDQQDFHNTTGIYNRIGRGVPDVAALGYDIAVFTNGYNYLSGGTSAAAPMFGAIITRINAERIKHGKRPLGFINPALYQNPTILDDITVGKQQGCHTDGFPAVAGWDPNTGLGTPNYPRMLSYFLSLP